MASTICARTPNRQEIYRYDGTPHAWTRIKQVEAGQIFGGRFGLVHTDVNTDELWWWRKQHGLMFNAWHSIGGPGATFAVTADSVYGLTPERNAVWRYNGPASPTGAPGNNWTQIGGPAGWLFGGTFGLFATNPTDGNIFRYLGTPHSWEFVGGPGASFAVTGESIYGLGNERTVWRYDGSGSTWTQVGGPAAELYAGEWGLLATSPVNGNVFRYLGSPHQWEQIGGPGAMFAVTRDTVFGLTPDRGAVFRYNGTGMDWTQVGGPAESIYAFEEQN